MSAHIVYAATKVHLEGAFASARSILENTKTPEAVVLHFFRLRNDNDIDSYYEVNDEDFIGIRTFAKSRGAGFEIHDYLLSEVEPFINQHYSGVPKRGDLKNPSNYVRFILMKRLSYDFCLWIDADTIVQGDVVEFMNESPRNRAPWEYKDVIDVIGKIRNDRRLRQTTEFKV